MTEEEQYIRQKAIADGLPPDDAVAVAQSEGGLTNPFQRGLGKAPKSQDPALGSTENSFGPYQLYISGNGAGLGDNALAAGVDPRKDWKAGVDYALDTAKHEGWGQWYGARKIGLAGPNAAAGNAFALQNQTAQAQGPPASAKTPAAQPDALADAPDDASRQQMMKLLLAASMANVRLKPVDYDPYAVMPKLGV